MKAAESAAPFLFAEAEIGAEKLEATGEFSGERLLARRPEVYWAICRMSAEGLSMSAMARALGVSRNTVAAVQEREQYPIEQHKKELLRNVRTAARLSVERVVELVPSINNAKDAAIVAAVMVDKLQLLSGEATARVERVEVNQDKLSEMLASLPVLEAEVVQLTGPSGSESGQKGLPGEGAMSGSGSAAGPVSDTESEGHGYAGGLRDTTLDATSAIDPIKTGPRSVDQEGAGGVGFLEPPLLDSTGLGAQKIFGKGVSSSQEAAEELSTN
jgi:transcriptional regulator with XRE-family HTH domain